MRLRPRNICIGLAFFLAIWSSQASNWKGKPKKTKQGPAEKKASPSKSDWSKKMPSLSPVKKPTPAGGPQPASRPTEAKYITLREGVLTALAQGKAFDLSVATREMRADYVVVSAAIEADPMNVRYAAEELKHGQ